MIALSDQKGPTSLKYFLEILSFNLAFQCYLISHNYLISFLLENQLSLAMATQFHCLYNCTSSPLFLKLLMNSFYHRPSQFPTEVLIFPLLLCWDPSYPISPQTRFLAVRHPSIPVPGCSDCAGWFPEAALREDQCEGSVQAALSELTPVARVARFSNYK